MAEIRQPQSRQAPRLGLVINSTDVFSAESKDRTEATIRGYVDELVRAGKLDNGSIITQRIMDAHGALVAADTFAEAMVDLIVIANVGFPNGHVFLALATHPNLARTPMAVVAEPEPVSSEWATNAWCGVIMNNYVAKQIGRAISAMPGPIDSPRFRDDFERLLRAAWAIRGLRRDYMVRFGDAPGGFHSATGNQLAFAAKFGTRLDTVDLTAVMNAYSTGKAAGPLGESAFTDADVQETVAETRQGRPVQVDDEMLARGARLYHAFRAIIRANGYTSGAFRCWPESNEPYIGISSCLAMGLLLAHGELTAASCESDWPTAVAQSMATLLSGSPALCLDWVNYTGGSDTVQLGHCGMGLCGGMAKNPEQGCGAVCDAIAHHPVLRQVGRQMGPVHIGQLQYGTKTGLCLMQAPDGRFKMLAFTGESSEKTAKGLAYSATDIAVPKFRELNSLILEHGFPHHLAVAFGDVLKDVELVCRYLDVEFYTP